MSISSLPASPAGTLKLSPSEADGDNKIATSATSFAVYAGRTAAGPTSLANFIGGDVRVKGPLLNKVRQDQYAGHGMETDALDKPTATFLSRLSIGADGPGHSGKNKVALPGMVRKTSAPAPAVAGDPISDTFSTITSVSSADSKPKVSTSLPMPGAINYGENRPRSAQGLVEPPTEAKMASPGDGAAEESRQMEIKQSPLTSQHGKVASPLLGAHSMQTSPSSSQKLPSASLTRLQGSSIVKQRLAWGEERSASASTDKAASSSRSTPINSPKVDVGRLSPKLPADQSQAGRSSPSSPTIGTYTSSGVGKRGSVMDRWNFRQTSEEKATSSAYKSEYGVGAQLSSPVQSRPIAGDVEDYSSASPPGPQRSSIPLEAQPAKSAAAEPEAPSAGENEPVAAEATQFGSSDTRKEQFDVSVHSGTRSQGSDSSAYKTEYGVRSPSSPVPMEPNPERKPRVKLEYEDARKPTETVLAPVLTAEPGRITPNLQSAASAEVLSEKQGNADFVRPTKPPTFTSWPKPQSHSSNIGRNVLATAPKFAASLPISVSPVAYTPSPTSPLGSSPRPGTFQPSSTSFPVSLGVAPTLSRPTSLAHFIGADRKVNGPVLNKARQADPVSEGVDMGDDKGRVGTFLSGMNKDSLLAEAARRKQGVAMPGMVPRSPGPIAPKPSSFHETSSSSPVTVMKAAAPKLPLPGMASQKLPLPGEANGLDSQSEIEQEQQQRGSAKLPILPDISSSFSPAFDDHVADPREIQPPMITSDADEDPSTSRLLRSGYETQRSIDSVQPSDRTVAARIPRPTAMDVTAQFYRDESERATTSHAETAGQSSARQSTTVRKAATDSADWQATLRSIRRPMKRAPGPPSLGSKVDSQAIAAAIAQLGPPPEVDMSAFDERSIAAPYVRILSVDILTIVGASAQAVASTPAGHTTVLYSSELLAIILRQKEGGLAVTTLYIWQGRDANIAAAEEGKIAELETRYRTTAIESIQGAEQDELVKALGGTLVIRQGVRDTFDPLNTTLYRVQSIAPQLTFVDELDLVRVHGSRSLGGEMLICFLATLFAMFSIVVRRLDLRGYLCVARPREHGGRKDGSRHVCAKSRKGYR